MPLLSVINAKFPENQKGTIYVRTVTGQVYYGPMERFEGDALVLNTKQGAVLIREAAIVAISDKRDALEG